MRVPLIDLWLPGCRAGAPDGIEKTLMREKRDLTRVPDRQSKFPLPKVQFMSQRASEQASRRPALIDGSVLNSSQKYHPQSKFLFGLFLDPASQRARQANAVRQRSFHSSVSVNSLLLTALMHNSAALLRLGFCRRIQHTSTVGQAVTTHLPAPSTILWLRLSIRIVDPLSCCLH